MAMKYETPPEMGGEQGAVSVTEVTRELDTTRMFSDATKNIRTHTDISLATASIAETTVVQPARRKRSRITAHLPPFIIILQYPRLLCALWAAMVQAILITSLETTLPLYTRDIFHFNSTGVGLIMLTIIIPTLSAPAVGIYSYVMRPFVALVEKPR